MHEQFHGKTGEMPTQVRQFGALLGADAPQRRTHATAMLRHVF